MPDSISADDVRHTAKLARLTLREDEIAQFSQQLDAIIHYVDMLDELDVDGVEPMAHALTQTNIFRDDDIPTTPLATDLALSNAPESTDDFFAVPKVLGGGGA